MNKHEKEVLHIFEGVNIKEILNDDQIANVLKFTLVGFEILYQSKKQMNYEGNTIDFLDMIKSKLFVDGQLKKIKI